MRSLADYEDYIYANFDNDNLGINLSKFKNKSFEGVVPVDLNGNEFLIFEKLKQEIYPIIDFLENSYRKQGIRPLWYKINVVDQAINEYVGVGFLDLKSNWLKFIVNYLDTDRADQGGDTIIVIFDLEFLWAVCFTLSQDNTNLTVEKFEN